MIILFLTNVIYISISVLLSLKFCYSKLFPSIFPFLFISQIIPCSIWLDGIFISSKNDKKNILGICKIYLSSAITGMLFGFIVGASEICERYKQFNLKDSGFTDAIFLSSNANIGFVISCVGMAIFNDAFLGLYLYLSQLIWSVLIYLIFKETICQSKSLSGYIRSCSFAKRITNSVKKSTETMISICAFTIIFRAIISVLNLYLNKQNDATLSAVISSFFEFTSGVFSASCINNSYISRFMVGFSVGFGGLSVILQTFSLCEGLPLKRGKFIFLKALQGILCGFSMVIFSFIEKN